MFLRPPALRLIPVLPCLLALPLRRGHPAHRLHRDPGRQRPVDPTAMEFAPDGRLFVAEQGGALRVIKNGALLRAAVPDGCTGRLATASAACSASPSTPTSPSTTSSTSTTRPPRRRSTTGSAASRADGDVAVAGSETVLLDLDDLSSATNHNGGALHFGPDGKLYIAVGENANGANAQTLANLLGKILRINTDGTIPTDNPFFGTATGKNRAIWALGLRNPFTFAFQPGTGRMFINDVGADHLGGDQRRHRRRQLRLADHRGADQRSALHAARSSAYGHGPAATHGCAITGGTFYNPATAQFPADYIGDYFFADYCSGWIRRVDPAHEHRRPTSPPASPPPVDLRGGGRTAASTTWPGTTARSTEVRYTGEPGAQHHQPARRARRSPSAQSATFTRRRLRRGAAALPVAAQRRQHRRRHRRRATPSPRRTLADNGATFRVRGHQRLRHRHQQRGDADGDRQHAADRRPSPRPPTNTLYSGGRHDHLRRHGHRSRGRHPAGQRLHLAGRLPPRHPHCTRSSRRPAGVDRRLVHHPHDAARPRPTSGTASILTVQRLRRPDQHDLPWTCVPRKVDDHAGRPSPAGLQVTLDGQPVTAPLHRPGRRGHHAHARAWSRRRPSGGVDLRVRLLVRRRRRHPRDQHAGERHHLHGHLPGGHAGRERPRRRPTSTTMTSPARR